MKNVSNLLVAMSMFLSSAAIAQNDLTRKQNEYPKPDSINQLDRTIRQEDSLGTKKSNPQYDRKTDTTIRKMNPDTGGANYDNRKMKKSSRDSVRLRKDTLQ